VKKSTSTALLAEFEALQGRFAHRIATRLTEHADVQSHEIAERLRVARERALDRARAARHVNAAAPAVVGISGGAAVLGADPAEGGWGFKLASVVPLLLLVVGLFGIQQWYARSQIDAAADVDALLLADDLPPAAYRDPGFAEFLKAPAPPQE